MLKEEKFLVQLPVDVDFLTFKLLVLDKEETTISIKLLSNKSNCFQKDYSDTLRSIKFLLWNKLFLNNTNYFLCNRYYEGAIGRNILYYVTTIWVGYDLTCSEMSSTQEFVQDIKFDKRLYPCNYVNFLLPSLITVRMGFCIARYPEEFKWFQTWTKLSNEKS